MAEYQAAILIAQMETFEAECRQRSENAAYLTEKLAQIPGIVPRKDYPGVTRTAFYYYGFRYKKEQFDGLSRDKFIAALGAEGIEVNAGLGVISGKPINKEGCLDDAFRSKAYQRLYPPEKLANYPADNECPQLRPTGRRDRRLPSTHAPRSPARHGRHRQRDRQDLREPAEASGGGFLMSGSLRDLACGRSSARIVS